MPTSTTSPQPYPLLLVSLLLLIVYFFVVANILAPNKEYARNEGSGWWNTIWIDAAKHPTIVIMSVIFPLICVADYACSDYLRTLYTCSDFCYVFQRTLTVEEKKLIPKRIADTKLGKIILSSSIAYALFSYCHFHWDTISATLAPILVSHENVVLQLIAASICIGVGMMTMYYFQHSFNPPPKNTANKKILDTSHDVIPSLRTFTSDPRPIGKKFRVKTSGFVVRVVLTGGPCAGKSSALKQIKLDATKQGFNVYIVPEIATIVLNAGFNWNEEQKMEFQVTVAQLQLQLEKNLLKLAAGSTTPVIMIFDRGVLDGKVYVEDEEDWQKIMTKFNYTNAKALGRYDCVVHLVTAANGARENYKQGNVKDDNGNDVTRRESPEEACVQDEKLQQAWKEHPQHKVISNGNESNAFQVKIDQAIEYIMEVANAVHPER